MEKHESLPEPRPGVLYVVSTPIGNLRDITLRALDVLRGVDLIAAEDTRTTRGLLRHYEIETDCISCYSGNERGRIPQLLARLESGASIAAVSDAGTPGLSDPAALLVSAAVAQGIPVVPIPGASAALAALVSSGMQIDRFHFEGFLPQKKRRRARIAALADETRTVILYESVHRLIKTLRELREALGERRVSVSRELTKRFEETVRGTLGSVLQHFETHPPRGEFVIVLEGARENDNSEEPSPEDEQG
ncbi:MAG: 16S rRNA (cytidine(1402)-2'-O)-methyltransferase [Ignavibacteriae bacterium]|nr:16S rRNA (cytidine(1402)-2'-O)-methyltransferase [Ignavibacteriota bacterium]